MAYLLDTCTVSEMITVSPNINVLEWFKSQDERELYLSVITLGELEKGIYQLPASKKRTKLEKWFFTDLVPEFDGRIINVDRRLMTTWAKMIAVLKLQGIKRPSFDSLLEATAIEHNLIFVTRNIKNFQGSSVTIFNPWED